MRLRVAVQVRPAGGEAEDEEEGPTLRPGNLEGLTGGRLRLRFARGPGIEKGAPVVTSADSWWIPPFLLAGTVSEVSDRDHDGVAEVRVRSAAALDGLTVVSVWRRPDPPPGPWREER
jgi:cell shape-determining protein MreC